MKVPAGQSKSRILLLIATTLIALSTRRAAAENSVLLDRNAFNPSLGETVVITVKTPTASRVSIAVLDRDGYVTRWLAKDELSEASHVATWNGRDDEGAVVPDEAYSFKVDVTSSAGKWTYFPAASAPKTFPVQARHYSRRDAALMYELPAAARIHAQAGSAAIDAATKKYDGPVLKTLVNREPRPAGAIVESWNGFDESGAIYVPDLPQFVTAILAAELPENAVIAFGNKSRAFLDVAAGRHGTSLLPPAKEHSHAQHHGLASLEDVSPALVVTPLNGAWDEKARAWMIQGDPVRLSVRLEGQTAPYIARQPGKIIVFVDYVQALEQIVRTPNETIELQLGVEPGRPHVVSVNWQSDYGPLSPNSIRVMRMPARKATRARERTEARDGR
jgi:hypothetical protein